MKNFLIYCLFITLSIIVNSCEEGYKDESTQYSLVLEEVTPVPSLTTDSTPNYTFSSNIGGNITYGGPCSSSTTTVIQGNNTITLDSLSDGTYSDCTITVDTTNSWLINSLTMSSFTIDTTAETLLEVTAVTTPTNDTTPNYTFSTNEAGTITYGGSCSSSATSAFSGDNTITFNSLSDGTYSDCTITVTNSSANSITLNISSFRIDTTVTASWSAATDDVGTVTGALTSGDTTDDTALVLSGTNESGSSVKVYNGSTELGAATVSGTSWTYSATVANGTTYQFNVKETDLAGNTSNATTNFAVTGDTSAPTANFTAATDDVGTVQEALTSGDTTDDTALVLSGTNESGSSVMVYKSSTELGAATVSGTSWTYSATVADGTTYQFNVKETDLAGNTSNATTNFTVTGDTTAPTVSSVAITSATGIQNNFLNEDDVVSVTATFSENVPVTGTPQLTLVVGSVNQPAPYASGDNSTTLVFQYTIQSGDNDTNGISIGENALDLSGGTIRDPAGNNATLTHSSVDNNSSYMVDTTAPTVDNFTISDTKLLVGETMRVDLGFSEKVIEFIAADINLDNATGTLPLMISSDDNRTWFGTFTPTADREVVSNTLSLTTSSYTDPAGNAGPSAITSNYEVETLAPSVSSIVISSASGIQNNFLNAGDNVSVTATFSENVPVTGTPQLTLVVGSVNQPAPYASSDNSTTLVFQYTILAGDNDTNGISIGENSLALNSGTISDPAGNNAILDTQRGVGQ